ncbi:MAG: superoxide dismutase [Patescibacteria group bacterium]
MFTLPDLPYAYNALEPYIDERTMQIHHGKHHAAYVKNLNDALATIQQSDKLTIQQLLGDLSKVPEEIQTKVRNNAGGHANHSLFWQVMSPNLKGESRRPSGELVKAIDAVFGSFEKFQEQFTAAGMGRFGSGWVWLVADPSTSSGQVKLTIVDTPNQDSPLMDGKTPILGLDVWEHAYYLKYQNMRADYIKAWWNVVNWKEVEKRFTTA